VAVDQNWVERAMIAALPEGWHARPDSSVCVVEAAWVVASKRYDLGDFRFRLTEDGQTLVCIHSTDYHCFPPLVEEATLIRLSGLTEAGLGDLLRTLMRKRRPNLTHPT
jgi:hypothetical protein